MALALGDGSSLGDSSEEEKMVRQTSIPTIKLGPSDWEPSVSSTKLLLRAKVCSIILPCMLPVLFNIPLIDHLNLVLATGESCESSQDGEIFSTINI